MFPLNIFGNVLKARDAGMGVYLQTEPNKTKYELSCVQTFALVVWWVQFGKGLVQYLMFFIFSQH